MFCEVFVFQALSVKIMMENRNEYFKVMTNKKNANTLGAIHRLGRLGASLESRAIKRRRTPYRCRRDLSAYL